jgi:hypothetical protein
MLQYDPRVLIVGHRADGANLARQMLRMTDCARTGAMAWNVYIAFSGILTA